MADVEHQMTAMQRVKRGSTPVLLLVAAVLGYRIVTTYEDPAFWLMLLLAALIFARIAVGAIETALSPIPKARFATPDTVDPDAKTLMDEPSPIVDPTSIQEPTFEPTPDAVSLVEVEEVPTHPPFDVADKEIANRLAEQDTELDPDRDHLRNPDAPVLMVPNAALRNSPETPTEPKATDPTEES